MNRFVSGTVLTDTNWARSDISTSKSSDDVPSPSELLFERLVREPSAEGLPASLEVRGYALIELCNPLVEGFRDEIHVVDIVERLLAEPGLVPGRLFDDVMPSPRMFPECSFPGVETLEAESCEVISMSPRLRREPEEPDPHAAQLQADGEGIAGPRGIVQAA